MSQTVQPLPSAKETAAASDRPLLDGRYQLVERLSRGSFGETFIAQDTRRPGLPQCVVKRFNPLRVSGDEALAKARQRFDQEAAILEQLGHHAQIPRLLAHFEAEGEFYLVQELIPGPSLQDRWLEQPQWAISDVEQLLTELLTILVFVHDQGVIHRDIKPDNIIYRETDRHWVLIDFGAVKQLHLANAAPDLGEGTMAIYSEGFTPAEQLEGHPCPSSDLYALGILCLQCLSGKHPSAFKYLLRQDGLGWLNEVVGHPPLAAILEKMTRSHWEDRYQTAQAVLDDLAAIRPLENLVSTATTASSAEEFSSTSPTAEKQSRLYTPTEIFQPPAPAEAAKLRIPTEVFAPQRSPVNATPLRPSLLSEIAPAEAGASPLGNSPLPKLPWSKVQARTQPWLQACNIYRWQDAIAFVACLGLVLGAGTFMVVWLAKSLTTPRQSASVETPQLASADALIASFSTEGPINDLVFRPDNAAVISAAATGHIIAWNVNSQQAMQSIKNFGAVTSLALSQNGRWLASGDEYANIALWDQQTGKLVHTLRDHQLPILSLAFSPDGKTLVSSAKDNTLIIWDVASAKPKHYLQDATEPITTLAISPDGQYLIGGSTDFTLKVWHLQTGQLLKSLAGHAGIIQAVAVSANGATLVSGSADQTIKIWNVQTGELINTLSGHLGPVTAIALTPNSQTVVSSSEDGTIRLWALDSGELLKKMSNLQGPVTAIAMNVDGHFIASSTTNGNINLWRLPEKTNP